VLTSEPNRMIYAATSKPVRGKFHSVVLRSVVIGSDLRSQPADLSTSYKAPVEKAPNSREHPVDITQSTTPLEPAQTPQRGSTLGCALQP
jgi:hypothetical protein